MQSFQLVTIAVVLFIAVLITWRFIRIFCVASKLFIPLFALLLLFSIGFSLRLMEDQSLIDLGYFFTEFSLIWGIVLYTSTLILGQVKYWDKEVVAKKQ